MQYQQNYLRAFFLTLALHGRLHRYAKNRTQTQTQPTFMVATPKYCLPCREVMHEYFKEVFIET